MLWVDTSDESAVPDSPSLTIKGIGNLLSKNQASGGDSLGNTTGFTPNNCTIARSTAQARAGTGSILATQTAGTWFQVGVDCFTSVAPVAGELLTFFISIRSNKATTTTAAAPYLATNLGNIDPLPVKTISQSSWTDGIYTWLVPSGITALELKVTFNDATGTGSGYVDCLGVWRGAAGAFALPGVPVPGQSRIAVNGAVDLSGTGSPEGVITAAPGSTWLQTNATTDIKGWIKWIKATGTGNTGWQVGPEADTGWRRITSMLINGWTATDLLIRRRASLVEIKLCGLNYTTSTGDYFLLAPTGFRGSFVSYGLTLVGGFDPASANAVNFLLTAPGQTPSAGIRKSRTQFNDYWGQLLWTTDDAWPASLPGTPT